MSGVGIEGRCGGRRPPVCYRHSVPRLLPAIMHPHPPTSGAGAATIRRLQAYIAETYCRDSGTLLQPDTPLLELNIIDSFAIFDLVNFLHSEFGVQVPIDRIRPDNFASIAVVARLVEELRAPTAE